MTKTKRGRPKGSTNHKTELRRAREVQAWLAKVIAKHLAEPTVAPPYSGRRLTIDLSTGEVVKPVGRKRRKSVKKVARKPRRAQLQPALSVSRRRAKRKSAVPAAA